MDVKAKVFNANVFFWKYITVLSLLFLSNFFSWSLFYYIYLTVVEDIVIIITWCSLQLMMIGTIFFRLPERGVGEHKLERATESKYQGLHFHFYFFFHLRELQSRSIKVFTFTFTFTLTWKSHRVEVSHAGQLVWGFGIGMNNGSISMLLMEIWHWFSWLEEMFN